MSFYDFCKIDYENEKYETNPFIFVIIMVEIKKAKIYNKMMLSFCLGMSELIIMA